MRTIGSISSDLCEMQRLRDNNIALGAKDLEWQARITAASSSAPVSQPSPFSIPSPIRSPVDPSLTFSLPTSSCLLSNTQSSPTSRVLSPSLTAASFATSKPALPVQTPAPSVMLMSSSPTQTTFLPRTAAAPLPIFATPLPPSAPAVLPIPASPSSSANWHVAKPDPALVTMQPEPPPQQPSSAHSSSERSSSTTYDHSRNTQGESHDRDHDGDDKFAARSARPIAPNAVTSAMVKDVAESEEHGNKTGVLGVQKCIGKIRRHRMTKEEEARFNPKDLADLTGSTAAKSRKMTDEERDIMLHKRRLRNRASAARSRDKQRKTINDLSDELEEVYYRSEDILRRCVLAERRIKILENEKALLKKKYESKKQDESAIAVAGGSGGGTSGMSPGQMLKRNGSMLRFSMSGDMLDKMFAGDPGGSSKGSAGKGAGLVKIPSKLHVSLSTDKLSDANFPFVSGSLPPLSRNVSVMERLLDLANTNGGLDLNCDVHVKE